MSITHLNTRRKKILQSVVEMYVETAAPVSSQAVTERLRSRLSAATVRNLMHELDELGLIWQPHTSAGRIPSAKGYRLYVDSLLGSGEFPIEDIDAGVLTYQKSDSIEDVILRGMHLCSEATSQASLAFFPSLKIGERLVERLEERLTGMFALPSTGSYISTRWIR